MIINYIQKLKNTARNQKMSEQKRGTKYEGLRNRLNAQRKCTYPQVKNQSRNYRHKDQPKCGCRGLVIQTRKYKYYKKLVRG